MTFLCQHCNATVSYALAIAVHKSKTDWSSSVDGKEHRHPPTETWCLGCIFTEGRKQEGKLLELRMAAYASKGWKFEEEK
jgi:hypothetical protein